MPSVRTSSPFPVLSFSPPPSFFLTSFSHSPSLSIASLKACLAMHMVPIVVVVVIINKETPTKTGPLFYMLESTHYTHRHIYV